MYIRVHVERMKNNARNCCCYHSIHNYELQNTAFNVKGGCEETAKIRSLDK